MPDKDKEEKKPIQIESVTVHLAKKDYVKLFGLAVLAHATSYILISAAIAFNERQINVQASS